METTDKIIALNKEPNATATIWQMPEETKGLLRRMYFADANDDEFALAVIFCQRTRLDPLSGQVNFIRRFSKGGPSTIKPQVSIDGFRLIAERTGAYAGQVGPWWCGEDGLWHDHWLDDRKPPKAARVGVLRHGFNEPLYAVAHWRSYVQKDREGRPTKFWSSMPEVMLAKVAEALALRKAFPHELGGVYSADEMMQADNDDMHPPRTPSAPPPTPVRPPAEQAQPRPPQIKSAGASDARQNPALLNQLRGAGEVAKIQWTALQSWACEQQGVGSFGELTNVQLSRLVAQVRRGEGPHVPAAIEVKAEPVVKGQVFDAWPEEVM